ncbi:MAG TPA: DNA (cytosine-5-)-methyltransferase [Frankiaceae bacterium]|nr:DNA (cytosine-5-)-methyltransferase [Frankiaceae bacterium]
MKPFTFIDLCAGIGGFHLGLARLGGRCVLAADIDASARATYARAFPSTPLTSDVWDLAADPLRLVPQHDLLAAGLPCQPFSKQGRERSIADQRGHLFFAVLAIVCARRPKYVVLENVRNLASRRHRGTWDLMVRSLRACGYRTSDDPVILSPHLLPPELGGTPQRRERVFLLAEYVADNAKSEELRTPPAISPGPVAGWQPDRWRAESILQPDHEISNIERYQLSPHVVVMVEAWNQLVRALPQGAVPTAYPLWADYLTSQPIDRTTIPQWRWPAIARNADFYRQHRGVIDRWLATSGIRTIPPSRRQLEWHAGNAHDLWSSLLRFRVTGLVTRPPTWFPTLLTNSQEPIIGWRQRRITPREAARLQGFPDDIPLPASDRAAYRQFGNAVHPAVVKHAAASLVGRARRANWSRAAGSIDLGDGRAVA